MLGLPLDNVTVRLGDLIAAGAGRGRLMDGGLGIARDRKNRRRSA